MPSLLESYIRDIPDFPKPGIVFKDISPLLENPDAFRLAVNAFEELVKDVVIDKIVGIESRGFLFGAPLADRIGAGFVMARKKNKLPADRISISYDLEYGTNTIEMHNDSITAGEHVLVIDDVLATGGTANAACSLVEQLGGAVSALAFLIELTFLDGRKQLEGRSVLRLIEY
ncbi:MAG TPA: adenine phosphoribosyltransferase [Candidatus Kapabacteria bacterium]|nr:adenine phosphoribosyltransferase [Candidatus Kapabacteria bacterium]